MDIPSALLNLYYSKENHKYVQKFIAISVLQVHKSLFF